MRCVKRQRPRCIGHLLVAILFALTKAAAETSEITDFVSTNILADGEVETRIYYKGLSAKETRVGRGSNFGLKFRQLTHAKHFIQLILDDDDQLIDCEFGHDKNQTESFLSNFKRDLSDLVTTSDISVKSLDGSELPTEYKWMNYSQLREECKEKHGEVKERMREEWELQHNQRSSNRPVRSTLILPGTKWCGDRNRARKYTDVGSLMKTDRCCRRHDFCKMDIPGLTKKYGYFNYSPFTLSHCRCDVSFRACLKRVGSGDANLVGRLFFNVVQTKCFVLKPKKTCVRHSWWGKCEKFKIIKQAILRDNLPY